MFGVCRRHHRQMHAGVGRLFPDQGRPVGKFVPLAPASRPSCAAIRSPGPPAVGSSGCRHVGRDLLEHPRQSDSVPGPSRGFDRPGIQRPANRPLRISLVTGPRACRLGHQAGGAICGESVAGARHREEGGQEPTLPDDRRRSGTFGADPRPGGPDRGPAQSPGRCFRRPGQVPLFVERLLTAAPAPEPRSTSPSALRAPVRPVG